MGGGILKITAQVFYLWSKWKDNVNSNKHTSNDNDLTESIQIEMLYYNCMICGPGSSVGIATAYGLDGLGIECR